MISLRSSLRRSLLTYLYSNRSARFYVRQMAERLGVDPTNLSRELARLEQDGFLRSEVEGRQLYYSIDPEYPLLKPLFAMLAASVGVTAVLKKALHEIPGIEAAYIYGSFAKNESDAASDIDVLIIGGPAQSAVASALRRQEQLLHHEINYIVLSKQELGRKLKEGDPFVTDIWGGKRVTLVEDGNEAAAS
jgi:predicted nucleotidyltransferase